MGLDKLEEALLRQRQDFAEPDVLHVIAKVLNIELGAVARVIAAYDAARNWDASLEAPVLSDVLDYDLMVAIDIETARQLKRSRIAEHLRAGVPVYILMGAILPDKDDVRICDGCPDRLRCIATNLSTPANCNLYARKIAKATALSIKGYDVTLEAEQPMGVHTVHVDRISFHIDLAYHPEPFPSHGEDD